MSTPMFVREVMTHRVAAVDAPATVEDLRRVAHRDNLVAVAVVNRQQPIAVLTRQQLDHADVRGAEPDPTPWFEQLGGQPPIVLAPNDLTADLQAVFYQSGTSVALVVDHHEIVGLVTLGQLEENAQSTLKPNRRPSHRTRRVAGDRQPSAPEGHGPTHQGE